MGENLKILEEFYEFYNLGLGDPVATITTAHQPPEQLAQELLDGHVICGDRPKQSRGLRKSDGRQQQESQPNCPRFPRRVFHSIT